MVAAVVYKVQYHADSSNHTVLTLFGRDTERKRVVLNVHGVSPYFYVPAECRALAESLPEVVKVEPGPPDIEKRPTICLFTRFPFQVPALRSRFPRTYEADIPFVNRVRMDHRLSYISFAPGSNTLHINDITPLEEPPKVEPRILYIDIETDDVEEGEIEEAKNPVTAISMYDSYTGKYGVIYVGDETLTNEKAILEQLPMAFTKAVSLYPVTDERELIGTFGALLVQIDPDAVDAYNGYGFDFPYLANRAKRLMWSGPDEDLELVYNSFDENEQRSKGRFAMADSMMIYAKQTMKQRDLSLEAVATELLGVGKVKHVGSVAHLQRTNPVKWLAYSLFDTHLLRAISEKRDMVNYLSRIAFIAGIELQDCVYNLRIVDGTLFQEARNNPDRAPELVLPTKPKEGVEEAAAAALVFDPVVDLHEWVVVIDNAQTYPMIERTFNISPETFLPESVPGMTFDVPGYGHFKKEPAGLIPRAVRRMTDIRQKAKDRAEQAMPGTEKREAETLSQSVKYVVNCLGSESLVATPKGPIRIVDLKADDTVYAYSDSGPVVARTNGCAASGKKPLFELKTRTRTVRASANHPFLTAVCPNGAETSFGTVHVHRLEWRALSDLRPADLIVISGRLPSNGKPYLLPNGKETTEDFCRFLGCFAGDGWVSHHKKPPSLRQSGKPERRAVRLQGLELLQQGVRPTEVARRLGVTPGAVSVWKKVGYAPLPAAVKNQYGTWVAGEPRNAITYRVELALPAGTAERAKYVPLTQSLFGYTPSCKSKTAFTVGNNAVGKLMMDLGMDHPAHEKRFPEWVFNLPVNQMQALIEGLVDSDGCDQQGSGRHGYWSIGSTSKLLLEQTRFLCYLVGYRVGSLRKTQPQKKVSFNARGAPIIQRHAAYSIHISAESHRPVLPGVLGQNCSGAVRLLQAALPEAFELQAVRSVKPVGKEAAYDIEVEGHRNFIVDGLVAHNSYTGVLKEAHWRMRRREAFESVTAIARAQLLWNRNHIEDSAWLSSILGPGHGARVVAGHTDSNWFKLYKNGVQLKTYDAVVPAAEKIRTALNESYNDFVAQYGATQHWLSCDLEGVLDVFRTLPKADSDSEGAKTRYFGTFAYKDGKDMRPYPFDARKKIMGVEIRRFNNSPLSKKAQERVIEMVCTGRDAEVRAYVDKLKESVLRGERDEDVLIPVKRNTTEANQPQIRAVNATMSVLGLKVRRGDVLRWFYVRSLRVKGVLHEVREMAIPSHLTLEDMRSQGVDIRLDREAMWAKVERAVELVYPDLKRKEEMLAEAF